MTPTSPGVTVLAAQLAIAIIQSDEHPTAEPFYKFAPKEPVAPSGEMKITRRFRVPKMTASKVFEQIAHHAGKDGEVLIVCHGTDKGPAIPLITYPQDISDPPALQQNAIAVLLNTASLGEEEAAKLLAMTTKQLRDFRKTLEKVRKKKLKRIEFRACEVGANTDTLVALGDVLGAEIVGGPVHKDAYTPKFNFPKGYSTSDFATWRERHPDAVVDPTSEGQFGYDARKESDVAFGFAWNAESEKALGAWVHERFPSAKHPRKPPALHGFFMPDDSLLFPLPDQYLSNLAFA